MHHEPICRHSGLGLVGGFGLLEAGFHHPPADKALAKPETTHDSQALHERGFDPLEGGESREWKEVYSSEGGAGNAVQVLDKVDSFKFFYCDGSVLIFGVLLIVIEFFLPLVLIAGVMVFYWLPLGHGEPYVCPSSIPEWVSRV